MELFIGFIGSIQKTVEQNPLESLKKYTISGYSKSPCIVEDRGINSVRSCDCPWRRVGENVSQQRRDGGHLMVHCCWRWNHQGYNGYTNLQHHQMAKVTYVKTNFCWIMGRIDSDTFQWKIPELNEGFLMGQSSINEGIFNPCLIADPGPILGRKSVTHLRQKIHDMCLKLRFLFPSCWQLFLGTILTNHWEWAGNRQATQR